MSLPARSFNLICNAYYTIQYHTIQTTAIRDIESRGIGSVLNAGALYPPATPSAPIHDVVSNVRIMGVAFDRNVAVYKRAVHTLLKDKERAESVLAWIAYVCMYVCML